MLWYNNNMEKIGRTFDSHRAADAADRTYYRSLSPAQRLDILLELIDTQRSNDETSQRLERIYRIVKRRPR